MSSKNNIIISIVIPCYNESEIIAETIPVLCGYVEEISNRYEIIIVDDGSKDNTYDIVKKLTISNEKIVGVRFTRNFGKEAAIHAGLESSTGEAVVVMDADLQHPPDLLKTLFQYWKEEKYEIVEAVKAYDKAKGYVSGLFSKLFNYMMSKFTGLQMQGASDYKLMDRRVVDKLLEMPERNRFFRGLVMWTGYRTKQVFFSVKERAGGKTKWSIFSLFKLSMSAITSFSNIALQIITILGVSTLLFSIILAIQTLYNKLSGNAVSGFATVIILSLLLNSVIMISLGIIGMYLANIYMETKGRPFYIISEKTKSEIDNK